MAYGNIIVGKDLEDFFSKISEALLRALSSALEERSRASLVLSGGITPLALFKHLRDRHAQSVEWSRIDFFWVDERCVPPESPDSNYGLAQRNFLSYIHPGHVYPMQGNIAPQMAALNYEETIKDYFIDEASPAFDCMLLGIGTDGHVASLFTSEDVMDKGEQLVKFVEHDDVAHIRLSLSMSVINLSRTINVKFIIALPRQ